MPSKRNNEWFRDRDRYPYASFDRQQCEADALTWLRDWGYACIRSRRFPGKAHPVLCQGSLGVPEPTLSEATRQGFPAVRVGFAKVGAAEPNGT